MSAHAPTARPLYLELRALGLDDQDLYILAGIGFALMYGLRPFFFKMQRPRDD